MESKQKSAMKIGEVAIKLFKEKGYSNVSVSDICEAAGVARSSFYVNFSSKGEIAAFMVKNIKSELATDLNSFMNAENDFDRLMLLYSYYVDMSEDYGYELMSALINAELEKPIGMFDNMTGLSDWFESLVRNCQKLGIIRNLGDPAQLVYFGIQTSIADLFDWCRKKGTYSLREKTRRDMEMFYDVAPEYRAY